MKKIHAFLYNLRVMVNGKAVDPVRITSKNTGLILSNPKPFDLSALKALADAEGLQVMYNPTPKFYNGELQDPVVFVGIGRADATDEETLSFLEGLNQQ